MLSVCGWLSVPRGCNAAVVKVLHAGHKDDEAVRVPCISGSDGRVGGPGRH